MKSKTVDVCLSDGLPCSRCVKGVGIGACVKSLRGKMFICCRFSDVSVFEASIRGELESYEVGV